MVGADVLVQRQHPWLARLYVVEMGAKEVIELRVAVSAKELRETLVEAHVLIGTWMPAGYREKLQHLELLINECDRHRPLGPDGRHGNRHTTTCGCEDKGHGTWCDHRNCNCGYSTDRFICPDCGHDYTTAAGQQARWFSA